MNRVLLTDEEMRGLRCAARDRIGNLAREIKSSPPSRRENLEVQLMHLLGALGKLDNHLTS